MEVEYKEIIYFFAYLGLLSKMYSFVFCFKILVYKNAYNSWTNNQIESLFAPQQKESDYQFDS